MRARPHHRTHYPKNTLSKIKPTARRISFRQVGKPRLVDLHRAGRKGRLSPRWEVTSITRPMGRVTADQIAALGGSAQGGSTGPGTGQMAGMGSGAPGGAPGQASLSNMARLKTADRCLPKFPISCLPYAYRKGECTGCSTINDHKLLILLVPVAGFEPTAY
jgi:hypothetical protein